MACTSFHSLWLNRAAALQAQAGVISENSREEQSVGRTGHRKCFVANSVTSRPIRSSSSMSTNGRRIGTSSRSNDATAKREAAGTVSGSAAPASDRHVDAHGTDHDCVRNDQINRHRHPRLSLLLK